MLRIATGLTCLAALALSGCSLLIDSTARAGVGARCEADQDCQGPGATCDEKKTCTLPCADEGDCPSGSTCLASFCRVAGAGALGAACKTSADCASSSCVDGLCVSPCAATPDCPGGSVCVEGACQLTLPSGFVFDNQVSNATQGFAYAHEVGRQAAVAELPWLEAIRSESNTNDTVSASIESLISGGAEVVVVTTNRFKTEAEEKARAHPNVQFLTFSAPSEGDNFVGYDVRIHQAWYVAGYVAARFDSSGKLAFLGAVPIPEVMRQLNAFTLGALAANPAARVEIVWANNFVPPDDIARKLVDYLMLSGSRVIVNRLGTGTSVGYISDLKDGGADIYSIGINNPNACDSGPTSCLGSPYYNWGPLHPSAHLRPQGADRRLHPGRSGQEHLPLRAQLEDPRARRAQARHREPHRRAGGPGGRGPDLRQRLLRHRRGAAPGQARLLAGRGDRRRRGAREHVLDRQGRGAARQPRGPE